jgi:putative toxin-antitoxin system antitoxin component (TIGR02293 family)
VYNVFWQDQVTATEYVIEALGGAKVFKGRTAPTATELRDRVRTGLPYQSLESMSERLNLSLPEAAIVLNVPLRTLARRRHGRRLAADESDRLYRLARIAAQAVAVLGSEEKAALWLRRPNRAVNGEVPLALLDTDLGVRQIEDVLGRIEHGVVS